MFELLEGGVLVVDHAQEVVMGEEGGGRGTVLPAQSVGVLHQTGLQTLHSEQTPQERVAVLPLSGGSQGHVPEVLSQYVVDYETHGPVGVGQDLPLEQVFVDLTGHTAPIVDVTDHQVQEGGEVYLAAIHERVPVYAAGLPSLTLSTLRPVSYLSHGLLPISIIIYRK